MAAEVDPAHVSVVHASLNMVQPMMSACQVTPATPMELLGVAPMTPARKVPCPVVNELHNGQGLGVWGIAPMTLARKVPCPAAKEGFGSGSAMRVAAGMPVAAECC